MISILLLLVFFLLLDLLHAQDPAAASSTSEPYSAATPNSCAWATGGPPALYYKYDNSLCPPVLQLQPSGACEPCGQKSSIGDDDCTCYCEMFDTFVYGQEQPMAQIPYCAGSGPNGVECGIKQGTSQVVTYKFKGNFKFGPKYLQITLNAGWNYKNGVTQEYSFSVHADKGQCGYFTFVPIERTVCGSLTQYTYPKWSHTCNSEVSTTPNVCQTGYVTIPGQNLGATVFRGVVVFVWVDCITLEPLPAENQNPIYNQPGVALDTGSLAPYQAFWNSTVGVIVDGQDQGELFTCNGPAATAANASDCIDAISWLTSTPGDFVPLPGLSDTTTPKVIAASGTCAVQLDYDETWEQGCSISYIEAEATAQAIFDNCIRGSAASYGSHALRPLGGCGSHIELIPWSWGTVEVASA